MSYYSPLRWSCVVAGNVSQKHFRRDSLCDRLIYRFDIKSLANAIMVFISSRIGDVLWFTVKSLSSIIKTPNLTEGEKKKKKRNAL